MADRKTVKRKNFRRRSQFLRDYVDLPYLKDLRPEDIEYFRRLPAEEIETILKDSPAHLVDAVADVLKLLICFATIFETDNPKPDILFPLSLYPFSAEKPVASILELWYHSQKEKCRHC